MVSLVNLVVVLLLLLLLLLLMLNYCTDLMYQQSWPLHMSLLILPTMLPKFLKSLVFPKFLKFLLPLQFLRSLLSMQYNITFMESSNSASPIEIVRFELLCPNQVCSKIIQHNIRSCIRTLARDILPCFILFPISVMYLVDIHIS